jgi:hypothetical protein
MSMAPEMRVSDRDRQTAAGQLKVALEEGLLDFAEYDHRLGLAYGATTYGDLEPLFADLPMDPLAPLPARPAATPPAAKARRPEPDALMQTFLGLPIALKILWSIWATVVAINLVVWTLVSVGDGEIVYFWPIWLLIPGTVLLGATVATNAVRHGRPESRRQLPPATD